ncbi:hypothetical protein CK203_074002 [Vitis vinifera]|uniref:Retrotransposon gag domain-containing protein n=1 Tax=Vitis vinifera TaxID=29760 RepID=A0A438DQ70_VITVI|nr:hypothetical protein CK203_074002 [Vitis vinifera]
MPATQTLHTIHMIRLLSFHLCHTSYHCWGSRSRMDRLERRIRRMRDLDEMIPWDDLDDVPVATLPVDEAQLLTLFPLSLSGVTQRWYASLESSRRRTWEDLAQEFLRQYSSAVIRVLHVESLSLLDRDHMRVPFQDFRSLVQALFDVDDGISRGLWSDIIPSSDTEMKGVGGSFESYGDVCSADFQHRRPGYHPHARSLQTSRSDSHPYSIVILIQFSSTLLCILILSRCDLHFSFSVHRLVSHDMSSLVPIGDIRGLTLIWGCLWIELLSDSDLLVSYGAVSLPISTTDTDLGPDMTVDSFPVYSTHAVPPPSGYTITFWTPRALIFTGHFDTLLVYFGTTLVLDSFSVVTGPRAEIDGMMIMIQSTLRLDSSVEVHHVGRDHTITLTALYEMMVDLTRRVERIELILSGHPSVPAAFLIPFHWLHRHDLRPSFGVLRSLQFLRIDFSHRRCRRHFSDLSAPLSRVFEMFQAMGFLAPLAPRALPDPVPPQFHLDLYCAYHQSVGHHTDRCTALRHAIQDIVDSGTFGHPQSDMSLISTPTQAMHADAPSPAVPDLIDLGD